MPGSGGLCVHLCGGGAVLSVFGWAGCVAGFPSCDLWQNLYVGNFGYSLTQSSWTYLIKPVQHSACFSIVNSSFQKTPICCVI